MNDHRDELGRPSTWVLAVAAGLFVIALNMVGDIGADISRPAALHVWRGVMAFAATLGLAHGGLGLLRGLLLVLESWPQAQPEPDPVTPQPVPVPITDDGDARAWRLALERFFRAGDSAGGFSIRKLDGVVGSTTWGTLTDFYCSEQGSRVLRIAPGDEGTTWGWGWQLDTVLQRLATGHLPRPTGPAPDVQPFVASSTRRDTKRQRATVVDGTATPLS